MFFESDEFKNLTPIKGSFEVLKNLKQKYRLVVVTSRQSILEMQTKEFLNKYYPGIFDEVLLGNHYGGFSFSKELILSIEGKKRSKPEMCKEVGAKLLIDDSFHYCTECATADIKVCQHGIILT